MVPPPWLLFWLCAVSLIFYLLKLVYRIAKKRKRKDLSNRQRIVHYSGLAVTLAVVIWGIVYTMVA